MSDLKIFECGLCKKRFHQEIDDQTALEHKYDDIIWIYRRPPGTYEYVQTAVHNCEREKDFGRIQVVGFKIKDLRCR